MKDCIKEMKDIMTSYNLYNRDMEWDIKDLVYNFYQQYDRTYSSSLADEFDMKYFLYQGGIIDDSRDFCVAHNGKVWTREEADTWSRWTPADGQYPSGYEVKQKDRNKMPSYLDYAGYSPLIDAGGYNCRHSIGFIPDEMAFDMRPDLKDKTDF